MGMDSAETTREEIESFREWQDYAIQILLLGGVGLALIVVIGLGYQLLGDLGVLMV